MEHFYIMAKLRYACQSLLEYYFPITSCFINVIDFTFETNPGLSWVMSS